MCLSAISVRRSVILSIFSSLLMLGVVLLVEFISHPPKAPQQESKIKKIKQFDNKIEAELFATLKIIKKNSLQLDRNVALVNEIGLIDTGKKFDKGNNVGTDRTSGIVSSVIVEQRNKLIELKNELNSLEKSLVSSGVEILGAGWLSKKSFQAYKLSNVLSKKELKKALKSYGASKKLSSRVIPFALRNIKNVRSKATLLAVSAAVAIVAIQEVGVVSFEYKKLSLWWKIGLPCFTFVFVFMGYLTLVRLGHIN